MQGFHFSIFMKNELIISILQLHCGILCRPFILSSVMDASDLKYPFHSAWNFLWQVIKPYRWWYVLMLQAPVLTAFYIFANNYSFKLLVDAFSNETITSYQQLLFPIALFITAQIVLDVVWRISDFCRVEGGALCAAKIIVIGLQLCTTSFL